MKVAAVMFDLDGTLVDSLEDLADAVNAMLGGFGKRALSKAEVCSLVGKGARNLVQRALNTESPADIELGLELFMEFNSAHIADKSRLYSGVREALEALAKNSVRMAVISNKKETLCRLLLKALEVDSFFEAICGGDTFSEMKPSPFPLLKMAERFGVSPGEIVMIGDSINDIEAGKIAGITTIGCTWGYGGLEEMREADKLAASFSEIPGMVLRSEVR